MYTDELGRGRSNVQEKTKYAPTHARTSRRMFERAVRYAPNVQRISWTHAHRHVRTYKHSLENRTRLVQKRIRFPKKNMKCTNSRIHRAYNIHPNVWIKTVAAAEALLNPEQQQLCGSAEWGCGELWVALGCRLSRAVPFCSLPAPRPSRAWLTGRSNEQLSDLGAKTTCVHHACSKKRSLMHRHVFKHTIYCAPHVRRIPWTRPHRHVHLYIYIYIYRSETLTKLVRSEYGSPQKKKLRSALTVAYIDLQNTRDRETTLNVPTIYPLHHKQSWKSDVLTVDLHSDGAQTRGIQHPNVCIYIYVHVCVHNTCLKKRPIMHVHHYIEH